MTETAQISALSLHPASELVPRMRPDEWSAFLADVNRRGVQEPIVVQEGGLILDGRHRWEAAKHAGKDSISVRMVDLPETEQVDFVIGAALLRRHLNDDQRAVLAARFREPITQAAKEERSAKANAVRHHGAEATSLSPDGCDKEDTRKQVAERFNVSRKKVEKAIALQADAPEEADKVLAGEVTLTDARREVARKKAIDALPDGPTPHQQADEDPGRRWHASLHKLYVLMNSTRDLGGIEKLARQWSADSKTECTAELRRIVTELTTWIEILEG